MILSTDIEKINEIIRPLLGHEAWGVKLGVGSFITLEFGKPIINKFGKTRGEWLLWIYYCGWYIENPHKNFIGSEDSRERLKYEIAVLEGQRLENVIISPIAFETNFYFSNSIILHTFPLNFIDPYEYWMLYTPNEKVLTIGPAANWSFVQSSAGNPNSER